MNNPEIKNNLSNTSNSRVDSISTFNIFKLISNTFFILRFCLWLIIMLRLLAMLYVELY
jgi:hypothetical protein